MLTLIDPGLEDARAPRSQTMAAHARLKADLLAGRVAPGEKLKINDLAAQLKVSPSAVREALSRMVTEGLVLSREQRGFTVAPISVEDLEDLTELRCHVEELAIRRAVALGDEAWEGSVLAHAHRLRRTPRFVDMAPNPAWIDLHEKFHLALVSACGSPRLLALQSHLHQQSLRYRILSVAVEEDRDTDAEHQALVDAALDRDADELVQRSQDHIRRTTRSIAKAAVTSWAANGST